LCGFSEQRAGISSQKPIDRSRPLGRRPLSTGELAAKLGISAGAVSQRKAKIQELLDRGGNFGF
jgi:biotin operon repressor